MRHPDGKFLGQALKKTGAVANLNVGMAVLTLSSGTHFTAKSVHHELQAVTDAKHGQTQFEHAGVGRGGVGVINRGRTAGQNDAYRGIAANLVQAGSTGKDHGKNILFADAARDELGILRTEV